MNYTMPRWALRQQSIVLHVEGLSLVYGFHKCDEFILGDERHFPYETKVLEDEGALPMSALETPGTTIA